MTSLKTQLRQSIALEDAIKALAPGDWVKTRSEIIHEVFRGFNGLLYANVDSVDDLAKGNHIIEVRSKLDVDYR